MRGSRPSCDFRRLNWTVVVVLIKCRESHSAVEAIEGKSVEMTPHESETKLASRRARSAFDIPERKVKDKKRSLFAKDIKAIQTKIENRSLYFVRSLLGSLTRRVQHIALAV
jgi:hypothetical protein